MATTYAIPDGRTVMAATLYTGNGGSQSIANTVNGVSMQPDFVWVKKRSGAENHELTDAVRGNNLRLASNTTDAQSAGGIAMASTGFALSGGFGTDNENAQTYVAWQWNAGGSTVTNTSGSISAQVRANTTAGFSVVTYTGTGANATVGHGLGVAPSMIIIKNRSSAVNWIVYHSSLGNTKELVLNSTAAEATNSDWNNTSPTSTVFSLGVSGSGNGSGNNLVAYCFAAVAGYSAFGSYTGNGSTDGTFVFLGFRPRWVMIKRTDSSGFSWGILDTSRNTYNVANLRLFADLTQADNTQDILDILSNGFKLRTTNTNENASGGTYIYAAFAENPFKYANAR
tara:strand:- start:25 stop:1047 length:1023 start_codon:yes stop_codon:yes gene_type:complete